MSPSTPDDVVAAIRDFVARIDELDPAAPRQGELTVRLDGSESRLTITVPVATALVEALRSYHDPRDHGQCDYCGARRLDQNFLCRGCGQPNGVFGQLVAERAARYTEPIAVPATPAQSARHARVDDSQLFL